MALSLDNPYNTLPKAFQKQISDWQFADLDDLQSVFEDADDILESSVGFRWSSKSTQNRQDRHLREYRALTILHLKRKGQANGILLGPDIAENANDAILFPPDHDQLIEYVCRYLIIAAKYVRPKRLDKEKISASTIISRQKSMLYWLTYGRKSPSHLNKAYFFLRTSEAIQYIHKEVGFSHEEKRRIYLGRDELVYLLDIDLRDTLQVQVHEQHALAWIIGLTCGVRPGSLCKTQLHPTRYLRLGDVQIQRDVSLTGGFTARLTFRGLKRRAGASTNAPKFLHLKCRTPSRTQDIGLSIPHRILIILLRRNALKDHQTVESLMTGSELRVLIKDGMLDEPLLLGAQPRGGGVTQDPLSADALNQYLSLRALWAGFQAGVSFYSWRSKALTQTNQVAGLRAAKMVAVHSPDSYTFEEHYDQGLYDHDATGVLEGALDDGMRRRLADMESEYLQRVPLAKFSLVRTQFVKKMMEKHPLYQAAVKKYGRDSTEMRVVASQLRHRFTKACLEEERKMGEERLTVEEYRARQDEREEPSDLFKNVQRRMQAGDQETEIDAIDSQEDEEELLQQESMFAECELRDVEDEHGFGFAAGDKGWTSSNEQHDKESVEIEPEDGEIINPTEDLAGAAKAFMEMMLEFSDTTKQPRSNLPCKLCEDDPTADEDHKSKRYIAAKLQRHMDSEYHFPLYRWKRAFIQNNGGPPTPKNKAKCPYGCGREYGGIPTLIKHIQTDSSDDDEHEKLKRADGWYDPAFNGPEEIGIQQKKRKQNDVVRLHKEREKDVLADEMDGLVPGHSKTFPEMADSFDFGLGAVRNALNSPVPPEILATTAPEALFNSELAAVYLQDPQTIGEDGVLQPRSLPQHIIVPKEDRAGVVTDLHPSASAAYQDRQMRDEDDERVIEGEQYP